MQVSGTFPELSSGMKKGSKGKGAKCAPKSKGWPPSASTGKKSGMAGFAVARVSRRQQAPATLAGRRAASHSKVYTK